MSINFNAPLKDLDGKVITDKVLDHEDKVNLVKATLGRVAANALLAVTDEDKNMTGETKVKRYDLAMKVINGKADKLKAEDISEIKKAIGKTYAPLIVGQAWRMLDPAEKADT